MSKRTLTPRKPICGLGTDVPGAARRGAPLQRALEQLRVKREQEDRERKVHEGRVGIFPRMEMGSC